MEASYSAVFSLRMNSNGLVDTLSRFAIVVSVPPDDVHTSIGEKMSPQSNQEKGIGRVGKRQFEAGERIIQQGEVSGKAYLIVEGNVRVIREENGREIDLAELGPNELFGEMSIVDNQPRSAHVDATIETHCLELNLANIHAIMTKSPQTAFVIFKAMCNKLREADRRLIQGFLTEDISFWYRVASICRLWHEFALGHPDLRRDVHRFREDLGACLGFRPAEADLVVQKLLNSHLIETPPKESERDIVDFEAVQKFRHAYQTMHGTLRGAKRDSQRLTQDDMTLCENILQLPEVEKAGPEANEVSFSIGRLRESILGGNMWNDLGDVERLENLHRCMAHLKPYGILKYDPINPQEITFFPPAYQKIVDVGLEPGGFFEKMCRKLTGK